MMYKKIILLALSFTYLNGFDSTGSFATLPFGETPPVTPPALKRETVVFGPDRLYTDDNPQSLLDNWRQGLFHMNHLIQRLERETNPDDILRQHCAFFHPKLNLFFQKHRKPSDVDELKDQYAEQRRCVLALQAIINDKKIKKLLAKKSLFGFD